MSAFLVLIQCNRSAPPVANVAKDRRMLRHTGCARKEVGIIRNEQEVGV